MEAVKLEGGRDRAEAVAAIVSAGIPVVGHLGLTPQSVNQLGGFRTQGRSAEAALRLVQDALLLQQAGCFALVLESIPRRLGSLVSRRLEIPTIGIGAGLDCDGQVLVTHDLLGMFDRFTHRRYRRHWLWDVTRSVFSRTSGVQTGRPDQGPSDGEKLLQPERGLSAV